MKNPIEMIDCQLRHILAHLVHTGYSIASLKQAEQDLLGVYLTLRDHIEACEAEAHPVSVQIETKPRGLLDGIGKPSGGAA
ncbi:hypothetical protein ACFPFP_02965 [Bradyrhizobium sp. GCM10023182]|uniref:Uncharacterized protein n=1 Tax=Bradyrhizobium zhengyangense TaxID=2911009 RepID=A0ABS9LFV6_9BRAD|nr:hypothetical protein [Bradyrhizobium zhengyangense]MCG2665890.1 hypothetical protein [Bradyrhizobium zhengyangense]